MKKIYKAIFISRFQIYFNVMLCVPLFSALQEKS